MEAHHTVQYQRLVARYLKQNATSGVLASQDISRSAAQLQDVACTCQGFVTMLGGKIGLALDWMGHLVDVTTMVAGSTVRQWRMQWY